MKYKLCLIVIFTVLTSIVSADNLYRVTLRSYVEAQLLESTGAKAVFVLSDGYLVLADEQASGLIENSSLTTELLAGDVDIDQIILDRSPDRVYADKFPLLFEENDLKILRADHSQLALTEDTGDWGSLSTDRIKIEYRPQKDLYDQANYESLNLDSLIGLVSQDSVESHLLRLEAFYRRLTGTDSSYAARDWIEQKFLSFGYDSVVIDPFMGSQLWGRVPVQSYNVVCTKIGTRYPERQIVISGHFDAVPDCPGADDDGSGTAGMIEIARVLADIETELTFKFIAFDSEESWMWGSYHYADSVAAEGADIIYMMNLDMIGHITNDSMADLYYGPEIAYSVLWRELSDSLVGIRGDLSGQTASDHLPFIDNGYDVTFVQEKNFSTHYHQPSDSTTYINFEYMTRMIKASLATVYVIDNALPPIEITDLWDVGDGQSMLLEWIPADPATFDHYVIHYNTVPPTVETAINVSADSSNYTVNGLTNSQEYSFYIIAVDADGVTSIAYDLVYGTPKLLPTQPSQLVGLPLHHAISLSWKADNKELDFSHYTLIRDGTALPPEITDTFFIDDDFTLGSDFHSYLVVAKDMDGYISDTTGIDPISIRVATLDPGRILAVNRSSKASASIVNEVRTGEFMRDALDGYNFDYYSDTAYGIDNSISLIDMLDYELVVFGAESGRSDDLGSNPTFGGILDTIGYYMSIGGKVVIFGRWSDFYTAGDSIRNIYYQPGKSDYGYTSYFDIDHRVEILSKFDTTTIHSELIGATSLSPEYPDLTWDSLACVDHSSPWIEVTGIPCGSKIVQEYDASPLYLFESNKGASSSHDGAVNGWRDGSGDNSYIFFEFPLSGMERSSANAALQAAVADLISEGAGALTTRIDPDTLDMPAGVPSQVSIYLGDFRSGKTAGDVNVGTILINNDLAPNSTSILPSHPDFTGDVLEIVVDGSDFAYCYIDLVDTTETMYSLNWQFNGETESNFNQGEVIFVPNLFLAGDANYDGSINVGDPVYIINYVFKSGDPPMPLAAGDANGDCAVNIGDAVYLIGYIFKSGPAPEINIDCSW
ncbi:MAG: M28 family peptidase [FCB group bacterium]|nr:M28 family peptidase [FCB group bacterium]